MSNTEDRAARIAAIRERAAQATPGVWHAPDVITPYVSTAASEWLAQLWNKFEENFPNAEANAAFIAHSREDIPWLLEQLARADRDRRALYPFVKWAQGAGEVDVDGVCCWCQRTDCTAQAESTCFGWQARKLVQGWEGR